MNEINCPKCKKAFKVDEAGFADILKQVRDQQFEEELRKRLTLAEVEKQNAIKLAEANLKNSLQDNLAKKEAEIAQIKAQLDNSELQKKLSITEAVQKIEKERDAYANEIKTKELEKQNSESTLKQHFATELQNREAIIKYKD